MHNAPDGDFQKAVHQRMGCESNPRRGATISQLGFCLRQPGTTVARGEGGGEGPGRCQYSERAARTARWAWKLPSPHVSVTSEGWEEGETLGDSKPERHGTKRVICV